MEKSHREFCECFCCLPCQSAVVCSSAAAASAAPVSGTDRSDAGDGGLGAQSYSSTASSSTSPPTASSSQPGSLSGRVDVQVGFQFGQLGDGSSPVVLSLTARLP